MIDEHLMLSAAGESHIRESGCMMPIRLFISSVQKEFASDRAALRDYLRGDALMRRFFEIFLFEDVPASDRRADELYLDEVRRCDIYVGLFGREYGFEDSAGISPTEREFDTASMAGKYRLIYVKGNPGGLPSSLTLEKLREPHGSVPGNPLLAEPMYLTKYIERMGTGTRDMIRLCREAGLAEPDFSVSDGFMTTVRRKPRDVTPEVTPEVRLALALRGSVTRRELQQALGLRDDEHFRIAYLLPALRGDLVEMTLPDKPNSRLQKYRLTAKGRAIIEPLKPGSRS